jgi:hypothetical protein
MTRDEELQSALERLDQAIGALAEALEQIGLLQMTLRRLVGQETGPAFDYRTGLPVE